MDFNEALEAYRAGGDAAELARQLVAEMPRGEQLACLEGDLPFWAGLEDIGRHGYHYRPFPAMNRERLGFPGIHFSDGPRGVVVDHATAFPVSMARGATFDPQLEEEVGNAIGIELRAVGATLYGGVCVNLLRHPAWGRAQETYGEDPCHVGEMGAALVRGVQQHAMAVVKHLACNSMENARFTVDVEVDEASLHEVYLPHFRRIVDEGVACVMSAYNAVNGEWCGDSHVLLTEILRGEWGFEGFVVSDWIFGTRDAAQAVRAGLNLEMPYRMRRYDGLEEAIGSGAVSWEEVEAAIAPTVATMLRFQDVLEASAQSRDVLQQPSHRALSRRVASASMVLLRNEPVGAAPLLPLAAPPRSTAVIGRLADLVNLGDGGSSDVWADDVVTPLAGLREAFGGGVAYHDGEDLQGAVEQASACELAVVVVGYTALDEGEWLGDEGLEHLVQLFPGPDDPDSVEWFEGYRARFPEVAVPDRIKDRNSTGFSPGGDRDSLRLHPHDEALIEAVAAANPRTVVVIQGGSAVITSSWDHLVPALIHSWYSGSEGGHALAEVLLGHAEPGGRMPISTPELAEHLPEFDKNATAFTYGRYHGWWHLQREGQQARYPFGFGLDYTTFEVEATAASPEAVVVEVANTGQRAGRALVQLYGRRVGGDGPPRLIGFARVPLEAGARQELELPIDRRWLLERDPKAKAMVLVPGTYELAVGQHAEDLGEVLVVELA